MCTVPRRDILITIFLFLSILWRNRSKWQGHRAPLQKLSSFITFKLIPSMSLLLKFNIEDTVWLILIFIGWWGNANISCLFFFFPFLFYIIYTSQCSSRHATGNLSWEWISHLTHLQPEISSLENTWKGKYVGKLFLSHSTTSMIYIFSGVRCQCSAQGHTKGKSKPKP